MLIDPQGLLHGDRVGACSDDAQLHFPRLLAASNSFGRFRMSMEWLLNKVYDSFRAKPSKVQLTAWLREYHDNFLLFVYKAPDGAVWAQWDIPEKLLGRYRLAADKKTPEPPAKELKAYRAAYVESLRMRHKASDDVISEGFDHVPHVCETLRNVSEPSESPRKDSHDVGVVVGEGEGEGEGVGEILAQAEPSPYIDGRLPLNVNDSRHITFRAAVKDYWRETVGVDCPWDGSEGKALASLLRANPNLTLDQFTQCLRNRAESHVQASDRPRRWLETITDYLSGPKNEYGKPLVRKAAPEATVGIRRAPAAQHDNEDDGRGDVREFWRLQRGSSMYDTQAPAWVKQEFATEGMVQ